MLPISNAISLDSAYSQHMPFYIVDPGGALHHGQGQPSHFGKEAASLQGSGCVQEIELVEQEVEGQIQAINEGKASSSNLKSFLSGYRPLRNPAHIPLRAVTCLTASCKLNFRTQKIRPLLSVQCHHLDTIHVKKLSSPTIL